MSSIHAIHTDHPRRGGRPLVFSVTETLVFVLITIALIATAALPAISRHPNAVQAKTVETPRVTP